MVDERCLSLRLEFVVGLVLEEVVGGNIRKLGGSNAAFIEGGMACAVQHCYQVISDEAGLLCIELTLPAIASISREAS
jgi:hypothetical protein